MADYDDDDDSAVREAYRALVKRQRESRTVSAPPIIDDQRELSSAPVKVKGAAVSKPIGKKKKLSHMEEAEQKVAVLTEVVRRANEELNAAREELDRARWWEPPNDGSIIRFEMQYTESSVSYIYAAVRVRGRWYSTGAATSAVSWENLATTWSSAFRVDGPYLVYDGIDATGHVRLGG